MIELFPLIYTGIILVIMTVILVRELVEPEIVIFSSVIFLVLGKIISIEEAFSGFSNIGVLTIALLFIVAGSLQTTGALNYLSGYIFGEYRENISGKLFRVLTPVSAASAFINNTPVVAMFIPLIKSWSEKYNLSPSKFFIPLSYAAILGGMCTLIGTSTNLIIHGQLISEGYAGFSFFEISKIGLPVAIIGLIYLIVIGHRLLPERKEPIIELGEHTREFVSELKVTDKYQNVGKTIEEAGLRHLKGLFLFQIEREGKIMAPARPNETLQLGDRLFFTGIPKTIVEFQKTEGLQLIKDTKYNLKQYDSDEIKTYETVISPSSPLIGKNVRESNFRGRYNAVILAIHRNGERIKKKIGDIVIRPGDTLLLLADKYFLKKWYNSKDFYLVSGTTGTYSKPQWNAKLSIFLFLGMILLTVLNVLPLITAAGLAAIVLILSRSISPSEVKNMVDWRVLIIIAGAIGIAQAIDNSGMARLLSNLTVNYVKPFGVIGILAGLYFMTSICTSLITNIAAAAFLFPIALSTALALNLDIRPFVLTITIAAAASFATPFSYQTNLMVYGPGGYKFRDYLRIGLPLQIIIGIVAVWLINMIYF